MKAVFIYSKNYKKELLISHKEVEVLQLFLKEVIKKDVLLLNTNLGLEVYYLSSYNCLEIIINSFLMILSKKQRKKEDFRIISINSNSELKERASTVFNRLIDMPMIFSSYSKSTSYQLNICKQKNREIVNVLLKTWQNVLSDNLDKESSSAKTNFFLNNICKIYLENSCSNLIKKLIENSFNKIRYN
ncbi:hypothetical protein C7447_10354 [Tenacibaculum adriaticum]|uniref:Uncharacterized protein n=1 Tax=Tenacibaculum adriaticum TaxID=413713 RepID=A0A5S5DR74_9FLAO|nr:hypothetical protein [Tenacibaculum adriaticum]TYP97888.1 hypothetical protein C7447_10354 [Tenacibaculum adriaticum]